MQSFRLSLKPEPQCLLRAGRDLEPLVDPESAHPDNLATGGDEHRVAVFFAERDPRIHQEIADLLGAGHAQRGEPVTRLP